MLHNVPFQLSTASCITENAVNVGFGFLPKKKLCLGNDERLLFDSKFHFSPDADWHLKP